MANHPIIHIEFPSDNPAGSGEFYHSLFGWEITNDEKLEYVMFGAEGGPSGGFPKPEQQAKPGVPIVYVHTDDIDASLAKAESLGGQIITPKFPIPGIGFLGFFVDPFGTMMGLYTMEEGAQG